MCAASVALGCGVWGGVGVVFWFVVGAFFGGLLKFWRRGAICGLCPGRIERVDDEGAAVGAGDAAEIEPVGGEFLTSSATGPYRAGS